MTAPVPVTADDLLRLHLPTEVLSPDDRRGETLSRVGDWLSAGSALVRVVGPVRRLARVDRADGGESLVAADDALDGRGILPGCVCPLAEVV